METIVTLFRNGGVVFVAEGFMNEMNILFFGNAGEKWEVTYSKEKNRALLIRDLFTGG